MKKKKNPKLVKWDDLKVGDFVEDARSKLFCYSIKNGTPSCMGRDKPVIWIYHRTPATAYYKRITPSKSFVKDCKIMLDGHLKMGELDNLSYIEALSKLKKHD